MSPTRACLVTVTLLSCLAPCGASAQSESVFDRYSGSVYKVEILENRSSTPSIIGTAFVADAGGALVTNYHVVKNVVFRPGDYRVQLVDNADNEIEDVRVVKVDAAHDLAVLRADLPQAVPLLLVTEVPPVGAQVFSLGFPRDLSGTVVEGSFSGPMPNSFMGTYHFTGSLNPGMSGGPTLFADGEVIGVNVATSGNQLSYLVPAARALELLARPEEDEPDLVGQVRASLTTVQDRVRSEILDPGLGETEIDGFRLPRPEGSVFDCSANPVNTDETRYGGVVYRCGLDDWLGLDPDRSSRILLVEHVVLTGDELLRTRFNNLYNEWFSTVFDGEVTRSDWATAYRCDAENVRNAEGTKLRAVQCWRRRPDLDGLYDLFARTAVLGGAHSGVVSTYLMSGTTRENGLALLKQAVEMTGRMP